MRTRTALTFPTTMPLGARSSDDAAPIDHFTDEVGHPSTALDEDPASPGDHG